MKFSIVEGNTRTWKIVVTLGFINFTPDIFRNEALPGSLHLTCGFCLVLAVEVFCRCTFTPNPKIMPKCRIQTRINIKIIK